MENLSGTKEIQEVDSVTSLVSLDIHKNFNSVIPVTSAINDSHVSKIQHTSLELKETQENERRLEHLNEIKTIEQTPLLASSNSIVTDSSFSFSTTTTTFNDAPTNLYPHPKEKDDPSIASHSKVDEKKSMYHANSPFPLNKSHFQSLRQFLISFSETSSTMGAFSFSPLTSTFFKTRPSLYFFTKHQLRLCFYHYERIHPLSLHYLGISNSEVTKEEGVLIDFTIFLNMVALASSFQLAHLFHSTPPLSSSLSSSSSSSSPPPVHPYIKKYYQVLSSHILTSNSLSDASSGSGWSYHHVLQLLHLGQQQSKLNLPLSDLHVLVHYLFQTFTHSSHSLSTQIETHFFDWTDFLNFIEKGKVIHGTLNLWGKPNVSHRNKFINLDSTSRHSTVTTVSNEKLTNQSPASVSLRLSLAPATVKDHTTFSSTLKKSTFLPPFLDTSPNSSMQSQSSIPSLHEATNKALPSLPFSSHSSSTSFSPSFSKHHTRLYEWWTMKGYARFILWFLGMICISLFSVVLIRNSIQSNLFPVFGYPLGIAKGGAMLVHLTLIFLLLSMCRISLTRLQYMFPWFPFHKTLLWHRYAGYLLLVASIVHTFAHILGTIPTIASNPNLQAQLLSRPSDALLDRKFYSSLGYWMFLALPSWTGWGLLVLLIMIALTSIPHRLRKKKYELFFYTHHLFLFFCILLCVHGTAQWIAPPSSWKYLLGPFALYFIERTWRLIRTYTHPSSIVSMKEEEETLVLMIERPPFCRWYQPGQYMLLNAPWISKVQWHPFSVTSLPKSKYLCFSIRKKGTWTSKLHASLISSKQNFFSSTSMSSPSSSYRLYIDGTFGGYPHFHHYRRLLFISTGIGCTPFLNMIHALPPGTQVDWIWITRNLNDLTWILPSLTPPLLSSSSLRFHVYHTPSCVCDPVTWFFWQVWTSYQHHQKGTAPILLTYPNIYVYYGRPDFHALFTQVDERFKKKLDQEIQEIGVFFCGAKPISKELARGIYHWNMHQGKQPQDKKGVVFRFHKEVF